MADEAKPAHWHPFNGRGEQLPESETLNLPDPPPWRTFNFLAVSPPLNSVLRISGGI
jgi:hypothetical protein